MNFETVKTLLEQPSGIGLLALALIGVLFLAKEMLAFFRAEILPRLYREYLDRKHVVIPFAETALDRHWKEGEFFRDGDPKLVDFRKGLVLIRPEVSHVEAQLRKGRFVHLEGPPSSGKTVIALSLAYQSLRARQDIIYFARPSVVSDQFFGYLGTKPGARHLDRKRTTLILDDVHLDVARSARLFAFIFQNFSDLRVVYISRPIQVEQVIDAEEPQQFSFTRFMPRFDISAETAVDAIAEHYSRQKFRKPIPPLALGLFRRECAGDLLILGRYLREWNGSSSVNLDELHAQVFKGIRMDLEHLRRHTPDAVRLMLVLGIFYRFELSVERAFLERDLDFDTGDLIERGDIRLDNGFARLHHSSQAKLYSNAIESLNMPEYAELSSRFSPFPLVVFRRYLLSDPRNLCEVVTGLRGSDLLSGLVLYDEILPMIRRGLEREASLDLVGWSLVIIFACDQKRGWRILEKTELASVAAERVASSDARQVSLFLSNLSRVSRTKAIEWLNGIEPAKLAAAISELSLRYYAPTVERVWRLTESDYFNFFVRAIEAKDLFEKLMSEEDLSILRVGLAKLSRCLKGVFCVRSYSTVDFVGEWTTKVSFHLRGQRVTRFISGRHGVPYGASRGHLYAYWTWLKNHVSCDCSVIVDKGASTALRRRSSLYPAGVKAVVGDFQYGEIVAINDEEGSLVAIGVSNYSSADLRLVKGLRSEDIASTSDIPPNRVFDNDRVVRRKSLNTIEAMARKKVGALEKRASSQEKTPNKTVPRGRESSAAPALSRR